MSTKQSVKDLELKRKEVQNKIEDNMEEINEVVISYLEEVFDSELLISELDRLNVIRNGLFEERSKIEDKMLELK